LKIKVELFYPAWSIFVAYMTEIALIFIYYAPPKTCLLFKTHTSEKLFLLLLTKLLLTGNQ